MKKKIFFVIDLIIPFAIFVVGILILLSGGIFTWRHAFAFIAIPLVMTAISALNWLVVESKFVKVLILLFLYMPIGFIVFLTFFMHTYEYLHEYEDEGFTVRYFEAQASSDFLPDFSEVGDTEDMDYYRFEGYAAIFAWEADVLICEYNEHEYLEQKRYIAENYVFEYEVEVSDDDYESYVCYPYAEIDGFSFRRLKDREGAGIYESYPKLVYVIGVNDKTCEIAYINYYDFDRDYISSFDDFIMNDCGWKYISRYRQNEKVNLDAALDFFKKKFINVGE